MLIVGGGFSGFWFADRMAALHPALTVRVVEATVRAGGRLKSDGSEEDRDGEIKDEMGAMRVVPEVMPGVRKLVERFGLRLAPLELTDEGNFFDCLGEA